MKKGFGGSSLMKKIAGIKTWSVGSRSPFDGGLRSCPWCPLVLSYPILPYFHFNFLACVLDASPNANSRVVTQVVESRWNTGSFADAGPQGISRVITRRGHNSHPGGLMGFLAALSASTQVEVSSRRDTRARNIQSLKRANSDTPLLPAGH